MTVPSGEHATVVDLYLGEAITQQLPLPEGLRALAEELRPGQASRSLMRLAQETSLGRPLVEVLTEVHSGVPNDLRVLMLAGAKSGRLVEVMEGYAALMRRRHALNRELWALLTYPALLFVLIFGVAMLNWQVVYPALLMAQDFNKEFKLDPPTPTWVFGFTWLLGPGMASIMAFLAAFALLLAVTWPIGGRRLAHVLRREIPLIGPLFRYHAVREFAELLGMFVRYGLPLPDALRFTAQGVGDASCAVACLSLAGSVAGGSRLGESLEVDSSSLLSALAPMVTFGERQGNLAETLDIAAEMYASRDQVQAALLKIAIPPLLLLIIGTVIGMVMMAIFLPLKNMISLINALT
ncbi:MAG: type II secretion system F family protein [Planctomycetes bacterium]|nr:type II secretion system F family protein [Planctomycetota bacterium]